MEFPEIIARTVIVDTESTDDDSKTDEPIMALSLQSMASASNPNTSSRPGSRRTILIQETVNKAIGSLKISVIEKMFKLRNALLEHLREVISESQSIDMGYRTKYITPSMLSGANGTQVKFAQLKVCKSDASKAVTRIE